MSLIIENINQYTNGLLKVTSYSTRFYIEAGIEEIIITEKEIKFKLLWLIQMVDKRNSDKNSPQVGWEHIPSMKEFNIQRKNCREGSEKDSGFCWYIGGDIKGEAILWRPSIKSGLDTSNTKLSDDVKKYLENRKTEFLKNLDIEKVPVVNFTLEQIPFHQPNAERRFVRIDIQQNGKLYSFIRINKEPMQSHLWVRSSFFCELADIVYLSERDMDYALNFASYDAGFINFENGKIQIYGSSRYLPHGKMRERTIDILHKKLNTEVIN